MHGEPAAERNQEEHDRRADERAGHQVEMQLSGKIQGHDAEEDDERHA